MYKESVDKTKERISNLIKQTVPSVVVDGVVWYDVTDQNLEAEVKLLRLCGVIAEHKDKHTLIRFGG